ncbi:hypothetical protein BZA05DRAFT_382898 [Tricharina praecox]|uniref:uncharacterized protein n=1 Tax=Tricharina praecox TaxID=43433 RepID=UPI00221F207A|nr:uncharacterized protein BZA05DRAFT_382898 [Tricharina praecox]KAI5858951.1 hypothetical protein BZA05DRAFT_382898 [Tricharina praecox]
MASPPSSPDLHPPDYLQSASSPPSESERTPRTTMRSPDPSTSSPPSMFLPPPIVPATTSTFSVKSALELQRSPLQQLQNQGRRLTAELQDLLDAQSLALMSPSTPSAATTSSSGGWERRKKGRKKLPVDLSAARTGILTAMRELSDVKEREALLYSSMVVERQQLLTTVTTHASKTAQIRQQLGKMDAEAEAREVEKLRNVKMGLAEEIDAKRWELLQLEREMKSVKARLAGLENVVEARQSSYKGALESSGRRMSQFLKTQGQESPQAAAETWKLEAQAFAGKKEAAEKEHEALCEGMELWESAMDVVSAFEERLATRLQEETGNRQELGRWISQELDKAVTELDERVQRAETEGWKLLIVAIGAEVQAMREAGEVLKRSFGGGGQVGQLVEHDEEEGRPEMVGLVERKGKRNSYSPLDD